ncbi:hypothetical protein D3C87_1328450 [compost metagenome]
MQRRQARFVGQVVAPARGPGRARAQAHGTVGAYHARDGLQRRLVQIEVQQPRRQPDHRPGVGRTAAQPRRYGQLLVQGHGDRRRTDPGGLAQRPQAAQDQVVALPFQRPAERTRDGQRQALGACHRHAVAHVGEGDQTGQRMIAVARHRPDVQEEVDLGRSQAAQRHRISPRRPRRCRRSVPDPACRAAWPRPRPCVQPRRPGSGRGSTGSPPRADGPRPSRRRPGGR